MIHPGLLGFLLMCLLVITIIVVKAVGIDKDLFDNDNEND